MKKTVYFLIILVYLQIKKWNNVINKRKLVWAQANRQVDALNKSQLKEYNQTAIRPNFKFFSNFYDFYNIHLEINNDFKLMRLNYSRLTRVYIAINYITTILKTIEILIPDNLIDEDERNDSSKYKLIINNLLKIKEIYYKNQLFLKKEVEIIAHGISSVQTNVNDMLTFYGYQKEFNKDIHFLYKKIDNFTTLTEPFKNISKEFDSLIESLNIKLDSLVKNMGIITKNLDEFINLIHNSTQIEFFSNLDHIQSQFKEILNNTSITYSKLDDINTSLHKLRYIKRKIVKKFKQIRKKSYIIEITIIFSIFLIFN